MVVVRRLLLRLLRNNHFTHPPYDPPSLWLRLEMLAIHPTNKENVLGNVGNRVGVRMPAAAWPAEMRRAWAGGRQHFHFHPKIGSFHPSTRRDNHPGSVKWAGPGLGGRAGSWRPSSIRPLPRCTNSSCSPKKKKRRSECFFFSFQIIILANASRPPLTRPPPPPWSSPGCAPAW